MGSGDCWCIRGRRPLIDTSCSRNGNRTFCIVTVAEHERVGSGDRDGGYNLVDPDADNRLAATPLIRCYPLSW
jgi:hypothetical protein